MQSWHSSIELDVLSLRSWHESPDPGGVHGPYGSIDISKIERRCLPSFPNANEAQLCHQSQHHAINLSSSQRETRCGLTQLSASGIHTGRPFISGRAFCFNQSDDVLFQGTAVNVSFPARTCWVLSGRDATPKTKFNLAAHSGPRNVRETQLRRPCRASSDVEGRISGPLDCCTRVEIRKQRCASLNLAGYHPAVILSS